MRANNRGKVKKDASVLYIILLLIITLTKTIFKKTKAHGFIP